jgi:hypothetical protein
MKLYNVIEPYSQRFIGMCAISPDNRVQSVHLAGHNGVVKDRGSQEGWNPMNIAAKLRSRRVEARNRRAVARAINQAATPAMRHELIVIAQNQANRLA